MQAVIFCGGRGTRITGSGPKKKELFEIGGYPILWHIMKILAANGCKDFVFPLGYRGDLIRRYFLEYERMTRDISFELGSSDQVSYVGGHPERDWRVTMVDTGVDTPKGERIRRIAPGRRMTQRNAGSGVSAGHSVPSQRRSAKSRG